MSNTSSTVHHEHLGEVLGLMWRCAAGAEYLRILRERENAAGLRGDPETDAFLKASALQGKRHSVATEYMLRLLGLDVRPDPLQCPAS